MLDIVFAVELRLHVPLHRMVSDSKHTRILHPIEQILIFSGCCFPTGTVTGAFVSMAASPSSTPGLQMRVTTELYGDVGAPLTNRFLNALSSGPSPGMLQGVGGCVCNIRHN